MSTGSLSPATYPTDAITIRCDRCSRVGRYKRRTLIERYGHDAAMPDVLNAVAACGRNERLSTERCEAYYAELRVLGAVTR
jgi:hypothetical protein